jgi:hypothetical protein
MGVHDERPARGQFSTMQEAMVVRRLQHVCMRGQANGEVFGGMQPYYSQRVKGMSEKLRHFQAKSACGAHADGEVLDPGQLWHSACWGRLMGLVMVLVVI